MMLEYYVYDLQSAGMWVTFNCDLSHSSSMILVFQNID